MQYIPIVIQDTEFQSVLDDYGYISYILLSEYILALMTMLITIPLSSLKLLNMMFDTKIIDDLANRISAVIPPGIKEAKTETEKHIKAILQSVLEKLDVVTRDEFDAQMRVLERTREKLEKLEQIVEELEKAPQK